MWNIYLSSDVTTKSHAIIRTLKGVHQVQSRAGSSTAKITVKLRDGKIVIVNSPLNFVVKSGAKVEIIQTQTEQGRVHYSFNKYK
jgi:hypothetical protein